MTRKPDTGRNSGAKELREADRGCREDPLRNAIRRVPWRAGESTPLLRREGDRWSDSRERDASTSGLAIGSEARASTRGLTSRDQGPASIDVDHSRAVNQIGDVHARSWIEARCVSEQQAAKPSGTESGSLQSTPAALQVY